MCLATATHNFRWVQITTFVELDQQTYYANITMNTMDHKTFWLKSVSFEIILSHLANNTSHVSLQ